MTRSPVVTDRSRLRGWLIDRWPTRARRRLRRLTGDSPAARQWRSWPVRQPVPAAVASALVVGGVLARTVGPVGAAVGIAYTSALSGLLIRRSRRAAVAAVRAGALDAVSVLVADLRAGSSPAVALAEVQPALRAAAGDEVAGAPLARRVAAAVRLAESTGAPLADLLQRVEADARARQRIRAQAAAEAAGAHATAWLLAALPLAGVAVGYGIGADPLGTLLHTRIGAACAGLALVLQSAGLVWADRLSRAVDRVL